MPTRIFRFATFCALVPAALAVTGCATPNGSTSAHAEGPTQSDVYVYAVDRAAERQGIRVLWVNPPKGGEAVRLDDSLEASDSEEESRN